MLESQEPPSQYFWSNLKWMVPEVAEESLLLGISRENLRMVEFNSYKTGKGPFFVHAL